MTVSLSLDPDIIKRTTHELERIHSLDRKRKLILYEAEAYKPSIHCEKSDNQPLDEGLFTEVAKLIYPTHYRKLNSTEINDVKYLLEHLYFERDFFISDRLWTYFHSPKTKRHKEEDFAKQSSLKSKFGIDLLTPDQFIEGYNRGKIVV